MKYLKHFSETLLYLVLDNISVLHFSVLVRFSGPTIHFVDEHYDTGRILAQRVVPVLANDTAEDLAARVLNEVKADYIINQLPERVAF